MTREQFEALLARRDAIQREHETACAILEEEGADGAAHNYRRCARLYEQLARVQEQIDAEVDAERRAEPASEEPPAA